LKKSIAIWVILLFILSSLIPVVSSDLIDDDSNTGAEYAIAHNRPDVVYVDDDYTNSTPGWWYDHFDIIQYGVDAVNEDGTVYVYNGTYNDYFPDNHACVRTDKSINLVGEDKFNIIIDANDQNTIIMIWGEGVNGVNVSGFTIRNSMFGIFVMKNKNTTIIYDNIIIDNQVGIYIHPYTTDVIIHDNIIMENSNGIDTSINSVRIEIYNNIITSNNEYGIKSWHSEISFYKNVISNNSIGIYINKAESNYVVYNNQIRDNGIGIKLYNSRSTITCNNFINNDEHVNSNKRALLRKIPILSTYRQDWSSNYWDDWNREIPKAIKGVGYVNMWILIIFPKVILLTVQIASFPYFEFDWHPAQEPYDIS